MGDPPSNGLVNFYQEIVAAALFLLKSAVGEFIGKGTYSILGPS
jgi:hypothetical protein